MTEIWIKNLNGNYINEREKQKEENANYKGKQMRLAEVLVTPRKQTNNVSVKKSCSSFFFFFHILVKIGVPKFIHLSKNHCGFRSCGIGVTLESSVVYRYLILQLLLSYPSAQYQSFFCFFSDNKNEERTSETNQKQNQNFTSTEVSGENHLNSTPRWTTAGIALKTRGVVTCPNQNKNNTNLAALSPYKRRRRNDLDLTRLRAVVPRRSK